MIIPLFQVNAFTDSIEGGNQAGVCPLDDWIEDELMQMIARENGWSETAFFVARDDVYDLRWFTPGCEVDLCGHATLATAHVIATALGVELDRYEFHTRSGLIPVLRQGDWLTLDMPANGLQAVACPDCLLQGLGQAPAECYRTDDYLLVYEDEDSVRALQPDFRSMRQIDARGTIVTAPSRQTGVDFVSRWFGGPDVGIDEDPVTGSAHCSLVPYWAERLGKTELEAIQASQRGGELSCRLEQDRVLVTGSAVIYLRGEILL